MSQRARSRPELALLRRSVVFLVLFAGLQLGWQFSSATAFHDFIVHDCTVRATAGLVNLLTPSVGARAVKSTVAAAGGGLNIINGCDGTEVLFLLWAALLVVPVPWKQRLIGFVVGTAVVYVVNQARILTLFYAYRKDMPLFDLLHGTVTPIAVVLLVCAYFYGWLTYSQHQRA